MKKAIALILAICLIMVAIPSGVISVIAENDDEYIYDGDFIYRIIDGEVTVEGCDNVSGEVVIPAEVQGYPVTRIGKDAFLFCSDMTSVLFPNTLKSIGAYGFSDCTSLKKISLPNGLTTIENDAFADCIALEEISLPDSAIKIGEDAFYNTAWYNNQPNDSVLYLGKIAYGYKGYDTEWVDITIKDGTIAIAEKAFSNGANSIYIPDSVIYIGKNSIPANKFYNIEVSNENAVYSTDSESALFNKNKTELIQGPGRDCGSYTVPSSVEKICESAFENSHITKISLPEGIKKIEDSAFKYAEYIKSIHIPASVISIGNQVFYHTYSLRKITVSEQNLYYTSDNQNILYNKDKTKIICYPCGKAGDSYIIPDGVECIGSYAFYYSKLKNIEMPDSVEIIENNAFDWSKNLETINISSSLKELGDRAFYGCECIKEIQLPDSLEILGAAFWDCYALEEVNIPDGITKLSEGTFWRCKALKNIEIPASVQELENNVFFKTAIEEIEVPDGVETIPYGTFSDCQNLKKVVIPKSVKYIEGEAFYECASLNDIWYEGDSADRSRVDIWYGNEQLDEATWHYNTCKTAEHDYLNDCDTSCGVCGYERTNPPHSFTLNGNNTCDECKYSKAPQKPIIESKTDSSITLTATTGFEYSKDGENWQTSNTFENLTAGQEYTFYQRVKLSANANESEQSQGISLTFKVKQSLVPAAPVIYYIYEDGVDLEFVDNYEYSMDGAVWQSEPWFDGLESDTEYTFYQRYAETETTEAGESSPVTVVKTKKASTYEGPLSFEINNDEVTITGCNWEAEGELIIPDTIDGYPVTAIGERAFYECFNLTSITLPESINKIGSYAFSECYNITSINIPQGVVKISDGAFFACEEITDINIPASVTSVGEWAFGYCEALTDVWYDGTKHDKNNITIAQQNDYLINADWHYNPCDDNIHEYDNICDPECNACDFMRDAGHIYGDDYICDECGFGECNLEEMFPDTANNAWYSDAISYAVSQGIMKGYADSGLFGTADGIQRQDFLVMLARYDGVNLSGYAGDSAFGDVPAGSYFETAVNWGVANGITTGYNATTFGVGDMITREQIVTFLYRYAAYKGLDTQVEDISKQNTESKYYDFQNVSVFSRDAVCWAIDRGAINGKENNTAIAPQGNAQRCEVAQIMYNIFKNDIFAQ